jgi:WD40-like Beta Propeller Repeat
VSLGARKWVITLVTGIVVGVIAGVLRPQLPGLSALGIPVTPGVLIVNEGYGNVLLLDPAGGKPNLRIDLPARWRDPQQQQRLQPNTTRIAVQHAWWDVRRNLFNAVSTLTSLTGEPVVIDSAVAQYYGDGSPRGQVLISNIEALSYLITSPADDRSLLIGDTLQTEGARIGMLEDGGRQRVLTRDSSEPVSWSADGSRLAYGCYVQHGSPQLCVYDIAAGKQRVYTLAGVKNVMTPAFSPDGQRVALIADLGANLSPDVVVVRLSDGRATPLTDDARLKAVPQWSPSGHL